MRIRTTRSRVIRTLRHWWWAQQYSEDSCIDYHGPRVVWVSYRY